MTASSVPNNKNETHITITLKLLLSCHQYANAEKRNLELKFPVVTTNVVLKLEVKRLSLLFHVV